MNGALGMGHVPDHRLWEFLSQLQDSLPSGNKGMDLFLKGRKVIYSHPRKWQSSCPVDSRENGVGLSLEAVSHFTKQTIAVLAVVWIALLVTSSGLEIETWCDYPVPVRQFFSHLGNCAEP